MQVQSLALDMFEVMEGIDFKQLSRTFQRLASLKDEVRQANTSHSD